jgi:nitroreductase
MNQNLALYTGHGCSIQNIHLAAYSLGVGTCWIGAFREEEARETLKIPQGIRP